MKTAMPFLSEIASRGKLGIDATKKIAGEGFNGLGRHSSRWMPP
jgi:hypothetical protein